MSAEQIQAAYDSTLQAMTLISTLLGKNIIVICSVAAVLAAFSVGAFFLRLLFKAVTPKE